MSTFNQFQLFPELASANGCITSVSRIPNSMEVFWINKDGSVHGAFWYDGGNWGNYELAPAGSASTNGSITAVSRIPNSIEVFWVGQNGSIRGAFWYDGSNWGQYELAPAGSASTNGSITAVSRIPNSIEAFWIGQNGSVRGAFWYDGSNWGQYELAPAGSASTNGSITVVSRIYNSMEVFWIGQNGSIQDAYWYEGANWQHFELAPAGNASTNGSISVVSRIPNSMEVFWIGQNGSVQDAYWYEGSNWQRFELTPAGNASTNGSISVVSRIPNSMEVFWIGQNGSVQDAYWYDQQVYHPRKVNWAIVLCKPVDDSSELQPKEFFIDLFHGVSNGSIRDYYAELTNNQIDFSGTDIIGWYTLKYKKTELTNYDADGNGIGTVYDRTTNIRLACEDVAQNYGVDFRKYSGVIVIYNYQLGDGGAWGIGASETMNLNGSVQNYSKILFDSAAWGNLDRNRKVISADAWSHTFVAHEVGHGLGIDHSRGSNNNDYGDPFDIMSAMTVSSYFDNRQFGQSGPGLNAPNLILLNAIHPFNFINYFSFPKNNSDILSETIKLYPTNSYIHVVKICKILNIDNTFYTIEFRMKTGWDENIDTSLFLHFVSVDNRNSLIGRCGLGETISKDHVQIKFLSIDGSTSNVEISGVYR